jgi:hypothetical protein
VRRSESGVFVSIRKSDVVWDHEIAAIFECGVVSIRFLFAFCVFLGLEGDSPSAPGPKSPESVAIEFFFNPCFHRLGGISIREV